MRRDINEEKFLKDVSEESIMKSWGAGEEGMDHEFSKDYKEFCQNLIKQTGAVELTNMKKKRFFKTPFGVAAAFAAVLVLSVGAYAISGLFTVKSEETSQQPGGYTYTFEAQEGVTVQPMKIVPGYLPEGYVETSGGNGISLSKYHTEDGGSGITIGLNNYSDTIEFPFISEVEETEIGGVKADVLTRNGDIEYNHIIMMFYEELGQVVTMYTYKDISVEEAKKIAENIKLEPTGEEAYTPFAENTNKDYEAEPEVPQIVGEEQIIQKGDSMAMSENLSFVVKDIELRDNVNGLDENYFGNYSTDLLPYINADGTFKTVELGYTTWENNEMISVDEGEGHVKLAYVTMEVQNHSDETLTDTFVYGNIMNIDPETKVPGFTGILEGWWRASGTDPMYYDGSDYAGEEYSKHLFYSDLQANETREIHMAIPYVQEKEGSAYLHFDSMNESQAEYFVKLTP